MILDEQIVDDAENCLILQQQHVQIREYSFCEKCSIGSDSRYRYKFGFVSNYA